MLSNFPASGDSVFRALIDSAPHGIVIVNQEGRIVLVNLQTDLEACSVGADCCLNLRLVNIKVCVNVLHVVVLFQRFDQPHHLCGLRAG
jgi:hypothetical protein